MSGLLNDPTMAPDFLVLLGAWNTTHINTSISCLAFSWSIILKLYIFIFKCYASSINSPVEKAAHEQAYIHSTTACSIFNKCLLRIYTNIPRAVKEGKFPSYTIRKTLTQHKQSLSLVSAHYTNPLWFWWGDHVTTTVQLLHIVLTYTRRRDAPDPSGSLMQSEG